MPQIQKTAITELEGLRGLLALWVLVGHWGTTVNLSFHPLRQDLWNVQAVDVFIILSGFVITLLLSKQNASAQPYADYLKRRFLRLWPTFIVVMAASIAFLPLTQAIILNGDGSMRADRLEIIDNSLQYFWQNVLTHVPMLHGVVPDKVLPLGAFAFVGQAWSISLEWQFYILAPMVAWWASQKRNPVAIVAIVFTLTILVGLNPYMGPAWLGNKLYLFVIGSASYFLWRYTVDMSNWLSVNKMRFITASLVAVLLVSRVDGLLGVAVWVAALHFIMISHHPVNPLESKLTSLLNIKIVQFLGYISYPLYLVHFLVMVLIMGALQRLQLSPVVFAALLLVLTVPASVVLAALVSRFVERPGMRLGLPPK